VENLSALLERLVVAGVEFVVVGGYAAVAHGVTLVTQDVDICCPFDAENLFKIQGALADVHPKHRMTPQKLPLELTVELCSRLRNLYLETDLGSLDCLSEVAGIGSFENVLQGSQALEAPFGPFRVLCIDTLIRAKEAMNRPHDKITVTQLRAIKERKEAS
jgi:hypothetical protein